MKKTLSFLMLLLVISTCVFASQKVAVSLDSFSFQSFVQKENETKNTINSKYGIGAGVSYCWEFGKGFILGADVKFDTYMLKGQKNSTDVSFLGKAGYSYKMSEDLCLFADIKFGLDLQAHAKKTSAVFEFGPELGVDYQLNERFDVFASCEALFGFPRKDKVKYTEYRVTPTIGVGYSF